VRAARWISTLFPFSFQNVPSLIQPFARPRKFAGQNRETDGYDNEGWPWQKNKSHTDQKNGSSHNTNDDFSRAGGNPVQSNCVVHLLQNAFARDSFHSPTSHHRLQKKIGVKPGASEMLSSN